MRAQDEVTDLLIAETHTTLGGLYYNGSCKMMDVYGSDGVNMFKTCGIFSGMPLCKFVQKTPLAMTVNHPASIYTGTNSVSVSTGVAGALVALTYNNTIYGKAFTNSNGIAAVDFTNPPIGEITYTVTVTAFNRVTYIGTLSQINTPAPEQPRFVTE